MLGPVTCSALTVIDPVFPLGEPKNSRLHI
jgi:hypothetical protein